MKKRAWLIVICLTVFALVLTSPGGAAAEPRYGGTLRYDIGETFTSFNFADQWAAGPEGFGSLVYEGLFVGDWDKGPSGTNEVPFSHCCMIPDDLAVGSLATELIIENEKTFVFKIRKGVRWQNKPPVNGREFTAEDVVYAYNKMKEIRWPRHNYMENLYTRDKYTFVLETNRKIAYYPYEIMYGPYLHVFPKEVYDAGMGDWKNHAGTGAWILDDYVADSHVTYKKNPSYWRKWKSNGKEYQLPFVDKLIVPLIADLSTRIAAIKTGKIDAGTAIPARFKKQMARGEKDLTIKGYFPGSTSMLFMRMDLKDQPTKDIRVRQAMAMAIDRYALSKTVFGGEQLVYLVHPVDPWMIPFTPLEEAPEAIKMLYRYDPERAKKLLAEAGYPKGFTVEVQWPTSQENDSMMEMVLYYWKQVGVIGTPKPMETATAFGKFSDRDYVITLTGSMTQPNMRDCYRDNNWNGSMFRDDEYEALWEKAREEMDPKIRNPMVKKAAIMYNSAVPAITLPAANQLAYWWNWVHNYHGEENQAFINKEFVAYIYLDDALRTKKIGKVR